MPTGIYPRKVRSARELFETRVERTESCWLWRGTIHRNGYGSLKIGGRNGKQTYAHRIGYELFVGLIPDGLELDHLCRVRHCVNPAHLEPVTRRENIVRGIGPALLSRRSANGEMRAARRGNSPEATRPVYD